MNEDLARERASSAIDVQVRGSAVVDTVQLF